MLEDEKRVHNDLKRTWQMANDQFLESQRLMMMDMRRMESVLTTEQQRQIAGKLIICLFRTKIKYNINQAFLYFFFHWWQGEWGSYK